MSAAMGYEGVEVTPAMSELALRTTREAWRLIDETDPGTVGYVARDASELAKVLAGIFLGDERRAPQLLPGTRRRIRDGRLIKHTSGAHRSYRPRRHSRCPVPA